MCLSSTLSCTATYWLVIHNMSATFDVFECNSSVRVGQLSLTYCEPSFRAAMYLGAVRNLPIFLETKTVVVWGGRGLVSVRF